MKKPKPTKLVALPPRATEPSSHVHVLANVYDWATEPDRLDRSKETPR